MEEEDKKKEVHQHHPYSSKSLPMKDYSYYMRRHYCMVEREAGG